MMKFGHLPSPSMVNRRITNMGAPSARLHRHTKEDHKAPRYSNYVWHGAIVSEHEATRLMARQLAWFYRELGRWPHIKWGYGRITRFRRALRLAKEMVR